MIGINWISLAAGAGGLAIVGFGVATFADAYYDKGFNDATDAVEKETAAKLAAVEKENAKLSGELAVYRTGFGADSRAIMSRLRTVASNTTCGYSRDTVRVRNTLAERANLEISKTADRVNDALQDITASARRRGTRTSDRRKRIRDDRELRGLRSEQQFAGPMVFGESF